MSRILALGSRLPRPLRRLLRRVPGMHRLRARLYGHPRLRGPGPGELRAVVYLPTWARWDVMRQRPQYVLAAFAAAGHPVYFVDPREPASRSADGVRIVRTLNEVPRNGVILYVHFAPLRSLFDLFEEPAIIYDIHDDLSIYQPDEIDVPPERRVAAHHAAALEAAHVVTVSAPVLAERHRGEAPHLMVVENGVDVIRFSAPVPRPPDLPPRDPDRPLVGYHGAISYWFDFELFREVAESVPHWRFFLVGPVDPRVEVEAKGLARLANVVLLGEKPSDAMPAYVQGFDVGTIWFRVTEMTQAVSPLKLYEYLAVPVPCVSTSLPACVASPVVRTADTPSDFVAALHEAWRERDRAQFRAAAAAEVAAATWGVRLAPVLEHLEELGMRRVAS